MTTNLKGNGTVTTGSHVSAALLAAKDSLIDSNNHGNFRLLFLFIALFFYRAL